MHTEKKHALPTPPSIRPANMYASVALVHVLPGIMQEKTEEQAEGAGEKQHALLGAAFLKGSRTWMGEGLVERVVVSWG